MSRGGIEPPTY